MRLIILLLTILTTMSAQAQVLFFQTDWGNELPYPLFLEKVKKDGYDGIETWLPGTPERRKELQAELQKAQLKLVFLCGTRQDLPFEESLKKYRQDLEDAASYRPVAINSHTGSDFWTLAQNLAFVKAAHEVSQKSGIGIYHETHRGRFTYTLPNTLAMAQAFPDLGLTLDVSHWMVVHERLIPANHPGLASLYHQVGHIHARIGHAEGPQVADPSAPEWKEALATHLAIWKEIAKKRQGKLLTITTEFGPPTYMPTVPFTMVPLADQWKVNVEMMKTVRKALTHE